MKLLKTKLNNGLIFFYRDDDIFIGQRVAEGKYEPYLTKLMVEQIKRGEVVVDAGANIGYDTLVFAHKVGDMGRVYAFEPEPENFEILKKNIKANKLDNVVAVKAGLGAENGEITLYKSVVNYGDHRLFRGNFKKQIPRNKQGLNAKNQNTKEEMVKIIRLDDYLERTGEKRKINLIKIDTQGWEPAVIKGAEKIITKTKPTIVFEYSPVMYREAGLNGEEMMDWLRKTYGEINYIDEYIQVYYPVRRAEKDCNLWVKNVKDFTYYRGMIKDFWLKKLIKRLIRRAAT